ncbi:unnamed protein product [Microthlaspi erraticum]|uniref:Uncharacterized protein n=1 Tax=Microthlaspi erraticum TaxID=1685480 RepID=A0A6D2KHD7_9BRAS|nr:unnamed protein product [Microthlaspi erraticum]
MIASEAPRSFPRNRQQRRRHVVDKTGCQTERENSNSTRLRAEGSESRGNFSTSPNHPERRSSRAGPRYYLSRTQTPNAIRRCRSTLSSTRRTTGGQLLMVGLHQTLSKAHHN